MFTQQWSMDTAFGSPIAVPTPDEARTRARADALMTWGHGVAFAGSLAGIAGGFALVAQGALSPWISMLLFSAPVSGMLLSSLLYAAAWYMNKTADRTCAKR